MRNWKEIAWAVLPGLIACFAILYQFFLSSGEFIYLDWNGGYVSLWPLEHFSDFFLQDWITVKKIPYFLIQVPFILLFGHAASGIFSKLYFLSMFACGSAGLYLFFKEDKLKYLLAVAILCFSPFVYERIMMGQFGVVFNILLAPLFLFFTKKYFDEPNRDNAILAAVFLTLSTFVQIHGIVLHFILFFVVGFFYFLNKKNQKKIIETVPYFFGAFVLLNLYWIAAFFILPQASVFSSIDSGDIGFFSPSGSISFNVFLKTAAQFGSWREAGLLLSYNTLPYVAFVLAVVLFIYLSTLGVMEEKIFGYGLAAAAIIGFVLALGPISPIFNFAVDFVPLFSGFRDSNKFVELITLFYAFLLPVGLGSIATKQKKFVFSLFIIGVIIYNYPIIGLANQLHPISIPEEYLNIKEMVPEKALYLPAGTYWTYNWSRSIGLDGRVITPAKKDGYPKIIFITKESDYSWWNGEYQSLYNCKNIDCIISNNLTYVILDTCTIYKENFSWIADQAEIYKSEGCLVAYHIEGEYDG
ncbi:MAG: hypothetical protein ABH842_05560 [Candidatus Micrarchaeota archaeon]